MKENKWVKFQWAIGRLLFRIGFINRILWDTRWPNKVFYYKVKI